MTANRIADAQKQLDTLIRTAYAKAFPDKEMRDFIIEIPKDTSHGDFASNAAMVNAKNAGKAPRDIAAALLENMDFAGSYFVSAETAGPGLPELPSGPELVLGCRAERAGLRCRLRPLGLRPGQEGDGGVCIRQPHRPDAHGQCPRRCHRRLPGLRPGLCRV